MAATHEKSGAWGIGSKATFMPDKESFHKLVSSFLLHLLVALLLLALLQSLVVKLYFVPSASMESTLNVGDRVLVSRVAYMGSDPSTGDIVVFTAPDTWEEEASVPDEGFVKTAVKWLGGVVGIGPSTQHTLIKRVIAGPGQTVECCSKTGNFLVDDAVLDEPYTRNDFYFRTGQVDCTTKPRSRRCVPKFTVPRGEYVVLGDNRSVSSDSLYQCRGNSTLGTCVRTVSRSDIVGKLFAPVFPFW